MNLHKPVLLQEVIEYLNIQSDGIYIDATFGRGGHSREILQQLGANGHLFAMDKDPDAILAASTQAEFKDKRFFLKQGAFSTLFACIEQQGWIGKVNGILLDLGVSSPQLDDASRGFSFLRDGPLDMRMDKAQVTNAKDWLNTASLNEIAAVLKDYGEERFAYRIAKAIVAAREKAPIISTGQLAAIVSEANPRWEQHKHPATRAFQAIRIFINQELAELKQVLNQSLEMLDVGGRLLVITFHSLEDRMVKEFLTMHSTTQAWPRTLPLTQQQMESGLRLKRINKAVRPGKQEQAANPRARSATLRIMEKTQ